MHYLHKRSAAAVLLLGAPALAFAQTQSGNGFNPKISLILNGQYAHYSSDSPATVAGNLLGGESDYAPEGFSIGETELALDATIEDQIHGWTAIPGRSEERRVGKEGVSQCSYRWEPNH